MRSLLLFLITLTLFCSCDFGGVQENVSGEETTTPKETKVTFDAKPQAYPVGEWVSLFNGKDLTGWTPKIRYHKLGENYKDTFRVEDGLLKVRYDGYDKFGYQFGHLFFKDRFSHYKLRLEYRFVGKQALEGPDWAIRNSGIMIHGEDPETMEKDQEFPVSIEVQLLGGDGKKERSTGNLCTPGTNVVMKEKLVTKHCISSSSKTYHGEQWVKAEVEVHGGKVIKHIINGNEVLTYEQAQYDTREKEMHSKMLFKKVNEMILSSGTISLQSESHPCDFRNIEIMRIKE